MTDAKNSSTDYDVEIDADELLQEIAEKSADRGREHAYNRRTVRDDPEWREARIWVSEESSALNAYRNVIVRLQPSGHRTAGQFRNSDGSVDVRGLILWLRDRADAAHQDAGTYSETQLMARQAERVYSEVTSLLRDDFGVGWPRIDDLGGVMEADMP